MRPFILCMYKYGKHTPNVWAVLFHFHFLNIIGKKQLINKIKISLAFVGFDRIDSQLDATHLVDYIFSHIQRARVK